MKSFGRIFSYLAGAFFALSVTAIFILPRPAAAPAGITHAAAHSASGAEEEIDNHIFQPITISIPGTVPQGSLGAWSNTTYTVPPKKRLVLEHIYIRATSSFSDDAIEAEIKSGQGAELSALTSTCINSAPAGYTQGYTYIGNQPVRAYFDSGDTLRFQVIRTYAYYMHSPVYYGVIVIGRLVDAP
jgi:hypothetical protein